MKLYPWVLEKIETYQRRAKMIPYIRKDGTMGEFKEARKGNSTYAKDTEKKISVYKQRFLQGIVDYSVMFITLVTPYVNSLHECHDSWLTMSKAFSPFNKVFKRKGAEGYFYALEATSEGCCHAHILVKWNRTLQVSVRKNKYYLAEVTLLKSLRNKWYKEWYKVSDRKLNNNAISIQVCPNQFETGIAFNYATKHLGMFSNITDALRRVKDNNAKTYDCENC
jgi:hypothetical protein